MQHVWGIDTPSNSANKLGSRPKNRHWGRERTAHDGPPRYRVARTGVPLREGEEMSSWTEEKDFRVFRELCSAFNALGESDLDDPFGAKPFRYLHEDVELEDYPTIPGAAWHVGHPGALQWTTNLW